VFSSDLFDQNHPCVPITPLIYFIRKRSEYRGDSDKTNQRSEHRGDSDKTNQRSEYMGDYDKVNQRKSPMCSNNSSDIFYQKQPCVLL
jgi:hypothetical protein